MSRYLHVYGTKGGVGKTTVAVNLAYQLASTGRAVGLLDLDVTGPNVPQLVADLPGEAPRMEDFRVRPGRRGEVLVSSVGYFVDPVDTPFLAGRYLSGAVVQLTAHPEWSNCDLVVVDLPPGFGELHRQVFHDLPVTVVLVSTSHVLASRDTERGIHLLRELDVPVAGLVENLSTVHCEYCGRESRLLDSWAMPWAADVKRLGSLPFARGLVVVDLPPGFGELHRQVFHDLPVTVVLVSTSHVLASRDTERGIHLLRELDVPVAGLVENLSTVHCEYCGRESRLLDSWAMPWAADVKRLGSLPFARGSAGDSSVPIVVRDDPADAAFRTVMQAIAHQVCGGELS